MAAMYALVSSAALEKGEREEELHFG